MGADYVISTFLIGGMRLSGGLRGPSEIWSGSMYWRYAESRRNFPMRDDSCHELPCRRNRELLSQRAAFELCPQCQQLFISG